MNGSAESGLPPRQLSDFPKRNDSVLTPYRFLSSMVSHTVLVDARETTGWQVTEDLIEKLLPHFVEEVPHGNYM